MTDVAFRDGRLAVCRPGRAEPALEMDAVVHVLLADGSRLEIPIERVQQQDGALMIEGAAGGFVARAVWRAGGATARHQMAVVSIRYDGREAVRAGLRVYGRVLRARRPEWLIPGLFYGENRLTTNRVRYPRWDAAGGGDDPLTSSSWAFRADRTALPAVFCWAELACVVLWADEWGSLGEQGLGFSADGAETAIWIDAPYREEPVAYVAADRAGPPELRYHDWQPGEEATVRFAAYAGAPHRHAYDALLREAYYRLRREHGLRPWLQPAKAADLAAEGLLRWHYHPEHEALYETATFDRAHAAGEDGDRAHMHVGWVSGAPWAAALVDYGRRRHHDEALAAGRAVLDKIAAGLSPSGAFWGEWRAGRGWSAGWNPGGQLHARTLAEATLFMVRALSGEKAAGGEQPAWASAVRSNLEFVARRQRPDGNCGAYYDPHSGEVTSWEGAAGLGWMPALIEGGTLLGKPEWLTAAVRAGDYYARFVEDELIYGAPEDVHLTPTSEDGYAAVIAYVALHGVTGEPRWLNLARRAADWMMTFRYAYNVRFPEDTTLAQYDFRTRGGDQASPANQHLHAYGLICLPEMLALWRATGDDYYIRRTRDNLACFLQFVARRDGDFGARRGMVSERFFQTDWAAPKGSLLPLSHAWSVGVLLHASLAALADEKAFPPGWADEVARG